MKRIKSITYFTLALVLPMLLGACSNNSGNFESAVDAIPENARSAAVLNVEKLGERTSDFLPSDLITPFQAILSADKEAINHSEIAIFTIPKGYTLGAVKIENRDKLISQLPEACSEAEGFGDYAVYDCGKRKIAIGESICYITPDIKTLKQMLKEKRPAVSAIVGVRQFLANPDEAIKTAAIASDLYGKKLEGLWLCRALHFTDSSISVDLSLIQPDGESGQIGTLLADEIDPAVLGFIPDGCSLVAATGRQLEGAKMFGIESMMRSYIPVELNLSESGTTAWYARPAGALSADDLLDPRVWNFASVSQASQTEGEAMIEGYLDQVGGHARKNPETDCYTVGYGSQEATFGYINGYSVTGLNGEINPSSSNSYTQDFRGARMVVIIDIPKGSQLQHAAELPCGASLNVKATTDNLHAKLRFYGNPAPALETIDNISPLHNLLPLLLGLR